MKNLNYDDIINRIGFFRNKANLSARETSQRLGYNPQFIKTIENKSVELKVSTLLDFCDVVGITIYDFFYLGNKYNNEFKSILEDYSKLNDEQKTIISQLIKNMGNK